MPTIKEASESSKTDALLDMEAELDAASETKDKEKMKELMEKAKEAGITLVKPSARKKAGNSRAGRKARRFYSGKWLPSSHFR